MSRSQTANDFTPEAQTRCIAPPRAIYLADGRVLRLTLWEPLLRSGCLPTVKIEAIIEMPEEKE